MRKGRISRFYNDDDDKDYDDHDDSGDDKIRGNSVKMGRLTDKTNEERSRADHKQESHTKIINNQTRADHKGQIGAVV